MKLDSRRDELCVPGRRSREGHRIAGLFIMKRRFLFNSPPNYPPPERKKENTQPKGGMGELPTTRKKKKENTHPREGWEDGTPPPHRDFKTLRTCAPEFLLLTAPGFGTSAWYSIIVLPIIPQGYTLIPS